MDPLGPPQESTGTRIISVKPTSNAVMGNRGKKRIFIDTEFSAFSREPKPISVGLVTEDGDEFYAELPMETWAEEASEFVWASVVPHLEGGTKVLTAVELTKRLREWLGRQGEVVLISDAPAFDGEILERLYREEAWPPARPPECRYFGAASAVPDGIPAEDGTESGDNAAEHHALEDAKRLRTAYQRSLERGWDGLD